MNWLTIVWALVGVFLFGALGTLAARPELRRMEKEWIEERAKEGWLINENGDLQKGDMIVKREKKSKFYEWLGC